MRKVKKLHGVLVPMMTPFTERGEIDESAAERITDHLIAGGCVPFILGTTGEALSIPAESRVRLVKVVVKHVAGRMPVYAGITFNCLTDSLEAAKRYFDLGIDAAVAHLPPIYRLADHCMEKHFETLADNIPGPLILYNNPGINQMSIPLDVIDSLSRHSNIVGLKDSETDEDRIEKAVGMWRERADFSYFAGTVTLYAKAMLVGSDGIVPAGGNLFPRAYRNLYDASINEDEARVLEIHKEIQTFHEVFLFRQVPGDVLAGLKYMMSEMGLCGETVLPPLCVPSDEEKSRIKEQM